MSRQDERTQAAAIERLRAAAGTHRKTPVVLVYTRQSVSDFDAEGLVLEHHTFACSNLREVRERMRGLTAQAEVF